MLAKFGKMQSRTDRQKDTEKFCDFSPNNTTQQHNPTTPPPQVRALLTLPYFRSDIANIVRYPLDWFEDRTAENIVLTPDGKVDPIRMPKPRLTRNSAACINNMKQCQIYIRDKMAAYIDILLDVLAEERRSMEARSKKAGTGGVVFSPIGERKTSTQKKRDERDLAKAATMIEGDEHGEFRIDETELIREIDEKFREYITKCWGRCITSFSKLLVENVCFFAADVRNERFSHLPC